VCLGVFHVQIQRVALHEHPGEIQHRATFEGVAARMDKHLSRHELVQIAPVLRPPRPFQIHRTEPATSGCSVVTRIEKLMAYFSTSALVLALSTSERAITFSASVSSRPRRWTAPARQ